MRAQAEALLKELQENPKTNTKALYRGSHQKPGQLTAWSENRSVANGWVRKGGGVLWTLPPGTARGIRVADHIDSSMDQMEKEWLVQSASPAVPAGFKQGAAEDEGLLWRVIEEDPAGDENDGVMIALVPDGGVAEALELEGGESADVLHITLAYLPIGAEEIDAEELNEVVQAWAEGMPELKYTVGGYGIFTNPDENVLWAAFDVPGLLDWRQSLVRTLEANDFQVAKNHGFTPHMTLRYDDDPIRTVPESQGEVDTSEGFSHVWVCIGSDWVGYPLGAGKIQPTAKTAAYDNTLIARGLNFNEYPESFAKRVVSGQVTAQEFVHELGHTGLGVWWGVMSEYGDLGDFEDHTHYGLNPDETLRANIEQEYTGEDYVPGEMPVVIIAKRPMVGTEPWDPEKHNPLDAMMGNSYLHEGQKLELVEIRYDAGWGWKSLNARGIVSHAKLGGPASGRIPRALRQLTVPLKYLHMPRPVKIDRPAQNDLEDVPPSLKQRVLDAIQSVSQGVATLEAKARELSGAFTVRITNAWRAAFYLGVDEAWHCFWVGDHNYDEAERRFAKLGASEPPCACCGGTGEHDTGQECYRCDASGRESYDVFGPVPCDGALGIQGSKKIAASVSELYGSNDPDKLFHGGSTAVTPWPKAGRRKDRDDYDKTLVRNELSGPPHLEDVDPRILSATQGGLQRPALMHYMGLDHRQTSEPYADKGNAGNKYPFVYKREDGTNMILSGHHRATAALLKGEPLRARVVSGPWPTKSG